MQRHAHTHASQESTPTWENNMGFKRDLLLQHPYVSLLGPQILLPGPGNPSAHREGRSHFNSASL